MSQDKVNIHIHAIQSRPTFSDIYVRLSLDLARRADCKRAQVGCVITDEFGTQVYGVGYNGGAAKDECRCSGEQGNCGCVHAEANALIKCRTQDVRKVLYTTSFPCKTCAKMIVNSGCIKVIFVKLHRDYLESETILHGAGVPTIQHIPKSTPSSHPFQESKMYRFLGRSDVKNDYVEPVS